MKDLHKKLSAYTAMSSAFLLAGAHEAEAQIQHVILPDPVKHCVRADQTNTAMGYPNEGRNININLLNGSTNTGTASLYAIDFNLTAKANVTYFNSFISSSQTYYSIDRKVYARISGNGSFLGSGDQISNVDFNQVIGTANNFTTGGEVVYIYLNQNETRTTNINAGTTVLNYDGFGTWFNSVPDTETGYVGFRFTDSEGTKYGWARISIEVDFNISVPRGENIFAETCLTVHEYAFNTQPDEPILAGELPETPVPTLSQWGIIMLNILLLIFGLIAVRSKQGKMVISKKSS